ncbi:hypothetical protein Sjap_017769 [Stephania japonica]|uniref:FACT complex subunit n=1 Tax=Stephania japonica TaxID=461633 RepID=A0AAP0I6S7_9MAGN
MKEDHQNGSVKGRSNAYAINLENFSKRLKVLYSEWRERRVDVWGSADSLVIATPPPSDDFRYLKSSALNLWLFGLEFPDTIMVFTSEQIHILCSPKKASLLEVLKKPAKESVGAEVVLHVKLKNDDGRDLRDKIFGAVSLKSKSDGHEIPVIGHIAKEAPKGKLLEALQEKLGSSKFRVVDITNGLSELFAVKDSAEIMNVKRAAFVTSSILKNFVVPKLEEIIEDRKKVSHSSLMADTEKAVLKLANIKEKLKAENVDICYPPIFQSGGEFDMRPNASSNDKNLYYESTSVIVCAIGARYNSYCTNVSRTLLIDINGIQKNAYEVLLKAHEAAIASLKPGNKASAAYKAALSVVKQDAPEFVDSFAKSAGTGIGIEFRESGLSLNAKNDRVLMVGMVFNVSLGFHDLQAQTANVKTEKFSLLLADTVIIGEKLPEVVTSINSKALKDVAYCFEEDEEEEERSKAKDESKGTVGSWLKATLRSKNQEMSKEDLRKKHQAELGRQKNEETARRLVGREPASGHSLGDRRKSGDPIAFKDINCISLAKDLMVLIDQKNEAILLPIYGLMVPFHVATIKNVTNQQDNQIRITFYVPGSQTNPDEANSMKYQNVFVKEISFHSKDPRRISELVQSIRSLRRRVASRELVKANRASLVTQEKLQLAKTKFKPIKLYDLRIHPAFGGRGRKMSGFVEAHVNGLRYSTSRPDEIVDIMYCNIKHAFFQPAEKEMVTLLHIHLHNDIMVGNSTTKNVQFYVEVMDAVQNLGGARSAYDPDEIEEEQRERDRKNRTNMEFKNFVDKVNGLWGQPQFRGPHLEFDMPLRELGFHGALHMSSVFIVPTSTCLIVLETPFLVISLSEIEIVTLERVALGMKYFDMTIVFKDFKKAVCQINSIPSTSLNGIKDWLNTINLKYYESNQLLKWQVILKTITRDPKKFVKDGGWDILNVDASDSTLRTRRTPTKSMNHLTTLLSQILDEDDDSDSFVESDVDEDLEDDLEEEEEKGKTWEELEREATNADMENGDDTDSEDERRVKKAFGKSRILETNKSVPPKRPKLR